MHQRVGEGQAHQQAHLGVAEPDLVGVGAQRPAAHELRDQVALGGGVASVVEDLDDAGVGEPGHHPRLAREPGPRLRRGGEVRVQELHRHLAVEGGIAAAVDDGHAAAAHLLEELVAAQHPDHASPSRLPPAGQGFTQTFRGIPPRTSGPGPVPFHCDTDGGISLATMTWLPRMGHNLRDEIAIMPGATHQAARVFPPDPGRSWPETMARTVSGKAAVATGWIARHPRARSRLVS